MCLSYPVRLRQLALKCFFQFIVAYLLLPLTVVTAKDLVWISVLIVAPILVLFIAIATTFVCVIQKRKQSLRSLHNDLNTVKDDHPIYEEVSPIEILQWYAEAVHSGRITVGEDTQHEMVDLPITSTHSTLPATETPVAETDIARHDSSDGCSIVSHQSDTHAHSTTPGYNS